MDAKSSDSPTKYSTVSPSKSKGWSWMLIVIFIAVLVAIACALTLWDAFHRSRRSHHHPIRPPSAVDEKYANALGIAMQFFDVQKCTS